jgi:hypothetical protein
MTEPEPLPGWLCGSWRREWIQRRGVMDPPMAVHYVQGPRAFGDLRIPGDRPNTSAGSLEELSDDECLVLARQSGFAGFCEAESDVVTWHHELDYQPTLGAREVDVGRVERSGAAMLEHALDGAYVELWWPLSSGDGRFLVLEARAGARLERLLVVAGDHFLFARNRAVELPPARSLAELVGASGVTRAERLAYLDCELSYGLVRGGARAWQIQRSTLPWREGCPLELPASCVEGALALDSGWTVQADTLAREDARVMFGDGV